MVLGPTVSKFKRAGNPLHPVIVPLHHGMITLFPFHSKGDSARRKKLFCVHTVGAGRY